MLYEVITRGVEKDERALAIEKSEIERLAKDRDDEKLILQKSFNVRVKSFIMGQKVVSADGLAKGETITDESIEKVAPGLWRKIVVENEDVMAKVEDLCIV